MENEESGYVNTEPIVSNKNKKSRTVLSSLLDFSLETNSVIVEEFKRKFEDLKNELNTVNSEKENLKIRIEEYNSVDGIKEKYEEAIRANKAIKELNKTLKESYEKLKLNKEIKEKEQNEFNKELDELKNKYRKNIEDIKRDIDIKVKKINEYKEKKEKSDLQLKELTDKYNKTKENYDSIKAKLSNSSIKTNEDIDINEIVTKAKEISNQMCLIYKNKLTRDKTSLTKKQEYIEFLNNEIINIKDEIEQLRSKKEDTKKQYESIDNNNKYKNDKEIKLRNKELKELKEKEKKYDIILNDIKSSLRDKSEIINQKKQLNQLLIQLANLKKEEVDNILYPSNYFNPSLSKEKEKTIMSQITSICSHK